MKLKKIILTLAVMTLFVSSTDVCMASAFNKKHPSDYDIGTTYTKAVKTEKPILALFYADWCGYCLKFMPKFNILNLMYKDKYAFVMVNVDEQSNKALIGENQISGYPTLYILDPKYDNKVHIAQGTYGDLGLLRKELDRYSRIREMLDSVVAKDSSSK
ncbi:MAG: protein disulfide isomerase family protein [Candidatus Gastranaerophilales bacterium]